MKPNEMCTYGLPYKRRSVPLNRGMEVFQINDQAVGDTDNGPIKHRSSVRMSE